MVPRRVLPLIVLLVLAAPRPARADFFITPFAGMKFGGSTTIVDLELAAGTKKFVLGATAMKIDNRIVGFDASFGNIAGYFDNDAVAVIKPLVKTGNYVNDLTGSVLLTLPPGATGGGLRPYAVIGGGLIHASAEDIIEVFKVRRTVPALTLGAGAIGMLTNNVGVRFDMRYLRSLTSDAPVGGVGRSIAYSRFTIGLMLRP